MPPGMALAATAGYARGDLCAGSDLDVVLLHQRRANPAGVGVVAERLWYPLWDAGIKLSPLTHSVDSALALAANDLVSATTFLQIRHLAGESQLTQDLTGRAVGQWRKNARANLAELARATAARHNRAGEVAFLLEPDLKDGRGGLRDVHGLHWALATGHPSTVDALESPIDELDDAAAIILSARSELHRRTGRVGDRLLLQEQDGVADGLAYADADELVAAVSTAARRIAWTSDQFWRRVERHVEKRPRGWRAPNRIRLSADLLLLDGEVALDESTARPATDSTLILRVGAFAAQAGTLPNRTTLRRLGAAAVGPGDPWPEEARRALVTIFGAGEAAISVLEALDQYGLLARVLPEWEAVRSKPQRNAYHRYTVDRHLCQAAANAAMMVRRVARPDLLLLGAWLHDIGKGFPGDHTEVGMVVVREIAERIGFSGADVEVLVAMVEHHLLLPDVATRRDTSDPDTIAAVASAVVDADRLDLLAALTEADSLATGSTAWSDWKAGLVRDLVTRTKAVLAGHRPPPVEPVADRHGASVTTVRSTGDALVAASASMCVVVAPDRVGLFSIVAGVLSMHGVNVLSADVGTTDDGIAVDEFRISRRLGGETNWKPVESDLRAALRGELDIETKLAEKVLAYAGQRKRASAAEPPRAEVLIDNDASTTDTIVEVRAPDGLALLHRVTAILAHQRLDIRYAKVATIGHEVVDAFYVRRVDFAGADPSARKLTDVAGIEALRSALATALAEHL